MSLFKNKDYILLRTGWSISDLGSQMQSFVFSLYILTLTGSAIKFSITLSMQILPMVLFAPISGYVADRFNRKKQIIFYDIMSAIVVLMFFILYQMNNQLEVYQIYLCVSILSVFQTFIRPVAGSLAQAIVDPMDYTKQKSMDTTLSSFVTIIAPALAGLFYGFGNIRYVLLINFASFMISAALESAMHLPDIQMTISEHEISIFSSLRQSLHYIRNSAFILSFLLTLSILNFILPSVEIGVMVISSEMLHLSPAVIGIENSALSVGILAGAVFSGLFAKKVEAIGLNTIIQICILATAVVFGLICLWLLLLAPVFSSIINVVIFVAMNVIIMVVESILTVYLSAQLQRVVPNELMGRTNAAVNSIIIACAPLGQITAGILLGRTPYFVLYAVEGLLCAILLAFSYQNMNKSANAKINVNESE